jgi:hypothetical protein
VALKAFALGVAITIPAPLTLAHSFQRDHRSALDASVAKDATAIAPAPPNRVPSGIATRLAAWVAATGDSGDLPFIVVDKLDARIFAFNTGGDLLGSAPVLIGLAHVGSIYATASRCTGS